MTEVISNYGLLILVLAIAVPLAWIIKRSQKKKNSSARSHGPKPRKRRH